MEKVSQHSDDSLIFRLPLPRYKSSTYIEAKDYYAYTVLSYACTGGIQLLEHSANVNVIDKFIFNCVVWGIISKNPAVVERLCCRGVKADFLTHKVIPENEQDRSLLSKYTRLWDCDPFNDSFPVWADRYGKSAVSVRKCEF